MVFPLIITYCYSQSYSFRQRSETSFLEKLQHVHNCNWDLRLHENILERNFKFATAR